MLLKKGRKKIANALSFFAWWGKIRGRWSLAF
jgi:hypothetical protein